MARCRKELPDPLLVRVAAPAALEFGCAESPFWIERVSKCRAGTEVFVAGEDQCIRVQAIREVMAVQTFDADPGKAAFIAFYAYFEVAMRHMWMAVFDVSLDLPSATETGRCIGLFGGVGTDTARSQDAAGCRQLLSESGRSPPQQQRPPPPL